MPYPALRVRSPVESSPSRTVDVPSAMVALIVTLLFFTVLIEGEATENATQVNNHAVSPSQCLHWGEWKESTAVQDGEVGWLHCPLFRQVYSYSSMQASGLTLLWYRTTDGELQEEPVTCKHKNCSKDREWLWLEPATLQDSGKYTCMLSNNTYCTSITMRLEVIPRGDGTFKGDRRCPEQLAVASREMRIPIQSYKEVPCPDIDMLQHRSLSYTTAWYHKCRTLEEIGRYGNMKVEGNKMIIYNMLVVYGGNYTCVLSYDKAGQSVNFTRVVHIVPVSNDRVSKNPIILNPDEKQNYTVKQGETAVLTCKAKLPYLEKPEEKQSDWFEGHVEKQEVWWTVDGKTVGELAAQGDSRFNETSRVLESELGDETREVVLRIQGFTQEDLSKEYNCTARNSRGNDTRRAFLLEEEVNLYVELSCGLGVIMVIMLTMFVIYHLYWLEILLFYRYHFGSDERSTDDKEYDVYISYARQSEEEEFVIKTLRRVLENELGYTVCIFDRDSLPGGTITDETLLFVNRCRRQIVVVSPKGEVLGTQAMLELRAGLDRMVSGGGLRVILVQYKPIPGDKWVRELRRTRGVLALVRWEGERSQDLSSRFWKRLQVELPVRRVNGSSQLKEVTTEESKVPLKSIEAIKSPGS